MLISILLSASVAAATTYLLVSSTKPIPEVKPAKIEFDDTFEPYKIKNLKSSVFPDRGIGIIETLEEEENYTSYLFEHEFDPRVESEDLKTTTGRLTIPNETGKFPIVLMIRGYVDQEIYETGIGTRNAANYFSENGFITVAPDYLGYAGSSIESDNIYETRFQTYTTTLSIISSLQSIKELAPNVATGEVGWDGKNLFIWAHSNGGQIALTTLAVLENEIPTTLWAPVTKPFPYSILYYTDESIDGGRYIRQELAKLEDNYDTDEFNFTEYLEDLNAPLQIHQGTADDAVPYHWSSSFATRLENLEKEVEYFQYSGADHNLRPVWDTVVEKDLEFFTSYLKKDDI